MSLNNSGSKVTGAEYPWTVVGVAVGFPDE